LAPSELVKELRVDRDVLGLADGAADTEFILLQQVAELITINEVDGRRPIAGCLALGFGREGAGCDQQTLVATTAIAPRKSRTALEPTLPT
jgi:hypothetical protein